MYDNIGRKIKLLAKISFIILAVASVITGAVLLGTGEEIGLIIGLPILFAGPLLAWISSWLLYGYGELIEKACEIERNTRGGERKSEAQAKIDSERINRIEKLRSDGLITEEEYQQAISKEQ